MLTGSTCLWGASAFDRALDAKHVFLCKGATELRAFSWGLLTTTPTRIPEQVHVKLQQQATIATQVVAPHDTHILHVTSFTSDGLPHLPKETPVERCCHRNHLREAGGRRLAASGKHTMRSFADVVVLVKSDSSDGRHSTEEVVAKLCDLLLCCDFLNEQINTVLEWERYVAPRKSAAAWAVSSCHFLHVDKDGLMAIDKHFAAAKQSQQPQS
mmetsp:Transcript_75448/g.166684  ORF Transcript_75448/g.166684 Transcript_75448/m.166684 type:complete len:213 (+) Transcript_75448:661-1299(+)